MAGSCYRMGPSASSVMAVLVVVSTFVTMEALGGQPRPMRLAASVVVAIIIAALVWGVAARMNRSR